MVKLCLMMSINMNSEKEEFWNTLTDPVFKAYGCGTCKYKENVTKKGECRHPDNIRYDVCNSWIHPSMTNNNLWAWDGETYHDYEYE